MEKFMLLFRGGPEGHGLSPEGMQAHMQKWYQWMQSLADQGIFVASDPLQPVGKMIEGFAKVVTDGPFVETKELVSGYTIINAKDLDHAVEIANGCPIFEVDGKLEVRPLRKMDRVVTN